MSTISHHSLATDTEDYTLYSLKYTTHCVLPMSVQTAYLRHKQPTKPRATKRWKLQSLAEIVFSTASSQVHDLDGLFHHHQLLIYPAD